MTRKTEETLQNNDKPCGLEGLKMEKWVESIYGMSRVYAKMIDFGIHKQG
jgi:hypothetical protein